MKLHSQVFRITKMASVLGVSVRGYYAWLRRGASRRELANKELSKKVEKIFDNSRCIYGSLKIKRELLRKYGETVGWTRDEAKAATFGYIWIFYNRKRIHEANGYITPEEYYALACA